MSVLIHTPFHDNLGVNFRVIFLRFPSEYNACKIQSNSHFKIPAQCPPLTFISQQQQHNALNPKQYRGPSTPGPLTCLFWFPSIFWALNCLQNTFAVLLTLMACLAHFLGCVTRLYFHSELTIVISTSI